MVGFEVHETDSADHAAHLVRRTALAEGVHASVVRPVQHGDNGATLKGTTVLAMLHWLGITPSHSRPRVSDDNAYAEALFRTAKYRPEFPTKGFADLEAARAWAMCIGITTSIATVASAMSPRPTAAGRRGWRSARRPPCAVSAGAGRQSAALERADPQLDADHHRHPQPGA